MSGESGGVAARLMGNWQDGRGGGDMPGLRDKIKHVVVLMLENRSFDCMLGRLYPAGSAFNGLTGAESNPHTAGPTSPIRVWNDDGIVPGTMTIPSPDPGELFTDMTTQLFGLGQAASDKPPPMNGFVDSYVRQTIDPPYPPNAVMHYFTPEQVPVISALAKNYAVCDQWYASTPNQTWPNRFFAHCATAGGYVNNSPTHFPYMMSTIFERISSQGLPNGWKVYFHDMAQCLTLARLWHYRDCFRHFAEFADDAAKGRLPCYAFIEPRYFADLGMGMPNDQHPPHDVVFAEQLIAAVYNTLRSSPTWNSTLFVITYDEHGGCFDHAAPPSAVSPSDHRPHDDFAFDRYGVRVPAVIVSPYIRPGTVLRAARKDLPHQGPPYPYDHTSIIATLRKCFNLGGPLTARDAAAPDLDDVLVLDAPTNAQLGTIGVPSYQPSQQDLQDAIGRRLSDMQKGLHKLASVLPDPGDDVEAHIAKLAGGAFDMLDPVNTVAEAAQVVSDRLKTLI
jgi:phospholipase C